MIPIGSLVLSAETEKEEKVYDDPDPETRIGEIIVHLESGKWDSFMLDVFSVNGTSQKSIQINEGQYILLQIRNNSGVRELNTENGLKLDRAEITMTNLLVRALKIENNTEAKEGEE